MKKYIGKVELVSEDMNLLVDILNEKMLIYLTNQPLYKEKFGENIKRQNLLAFLKNDLYNISKYALNNFYKELHYKMAHIRRELEKSNKEYETILKLKKLRELRELFANVELDENELKAIPIFLKCMEIEHNKNIAFIIENEIYIRKRIKKEINLLNINQDNCFVDEFDPEIEEELNSFCKQVGVNDEEYKLESNMKELENKYVINDESILSIDDIDKKIQLDVFSGDSEVGYYKELSEEDFFKIIKDLGEHNSKIKEKFKNLLKLSNEWGAHTEDKLYEMWMVWTDEEVSVIDKVLKKSLYGEVIKKSDLDELEDMSENIMYRHLLSRIVLHLIYRRMSSQYLEEVLG